MGPPAFCPARLTGELSVMRQIISYLLVMRCITGINQENRKYYWILALQQTTISDLLQMYAAVFGPL